MSEKDYNQMREDLFKNLEEVFGGLVDTVMSCLDNTEDEETPRENKETECKGKEHCECACAKCECKETDNTAECLSDGQNSSLTLADKLYAKHYATWLDKFGNKAIDCKQACSEEPEDTMTPVLDKVVIMFKNIVNGSLLPDAAHAGLDNMYYELSDATHFDYYITFGGGFDGYNEKPYAKLAIDLVDLHDQDFIKFCKDCMNKENYLEDFSEALIDRLGFNGYDAVMDNNQIVLKLYYWVD